jgi:hypothetical protein
MIKHSPIVGFWHFSQKELCRYVKLETQHGAIELSAKHLIYGYKNEKASYIYAKDVVIGDQLMHASGDLHSIE